MSRIQLGFIPEPISVPLDSVLPSKQPTAGLTGSRKFKQIVSSIQEVGLIEPLSVLPEDKHLGGFVLLDGHLRLLALRILRITHAACLVSTDDEGYTCNNRVNRLSALQEHYMIRRAMEKGASPERLAKALGVNLSHIISKATLLDGICPEAIDLLKDQQFSPSLSRVIRRMKPTRQVECIELMLAANNITAAYAEALLAATPTDRLIEGKRRPRRVVASQEQIAKMEREMSNLQSRYKLAEQSFGQDVLNLVLARGYLAKLLENEEIMRYLLAHHPDLVKEFELILESVSLEQS
ncbi:ParB N-terminal domain-containing protein [Caballeronia novacaledonica]|uniref:plasmid partitioning protein RepB C-terminal domain-containing protein n=1 Tax=Caballeronia novacaledonica TaxID=1544861 RepID=UPI001EE1E9D2|nr:plasmid partitioning protein RepB C-terminal domain-containing protein [Caballeronia novacaledonica]GJH13003.1 ParB N-terminal domain-containing protein [Caballeronia novacaledonica]